MQGVADRKGSMITKYSVAFDQLLLACRPVYGRPHRLSLALLSKVAAHCVRSATQLHLEPPLVHWPFLACIPRYWWSP